MTQAGVAIAALFFASVSAAAEFRTGQPVMGTILQVTVIADNASNARRAAEDCIAEAQRWDDVLTTWRPEGELARLNRAAGTGSVALSTELSFALERMLALAKRTNGAFDPGVGPLVTAWRDGRSAGPPFPPTRIQSSLRLRSRTASLIRGARLDSGAVGKGMALDALAQLLRERGIVAAFLDFGGSSHLAVGAPPESPDGWTVAVTGLEDGVVHGTIALRDGALSTSRTRSADATDGPVFDPQTGRPVTSQRAVTVWHARATDADAWSTALVVLGRKGIEQARSAGVEALLEGADGVTKTEGFRLQQLDVGGQRPLEG
jgi:thiamine biosynthesis lipoprotein